MKKRRKPPPWPVWGWPNHHDKEQNGGGRNHPQGSTTSIWPRVGSATSTRLKRRKKKKKKVPATPRNFALGGGFGHPYFTLWDGSATLKPVMRVAQLPLFCLKGWLPLFFFSFLFFFFFFFIFQFFIFFN
jgi:hypothetical protein